MRPLRYISVPKNVSRTRFRGDCAAFSGRLVICNMHTPLGNCDYMFYMARWLYVCTCVHPPGFVNSVWVGQIHLAFQITLADTLGHIKKLLAGSEAHISINPRRNDVLYTGHGSVQLHWICCGYWTLESGKWNPDLLGWLLGSVNWFSRPGF